MARTKTYRQLKKQTRRIYENYMELYRNADRHSGSRTYVQSNTNDPLGVPSTPVFLRALSMEKERRNQLDERMEKARNIANAYTRNMQKILGENPSTDWIGYYEDKPFTKEEYTTGNAETAAKGNSNS